MHTSLQAILAHSEDFVHEMESEGGLEQYSMYLDGLLEDVPRLENRVTAQRLQDALSFLQQNYSLYERNPKLRDTIIIPAIQRFVEVVKEEAEEAAKRELFAFRNGEQTKG